jgi:hypothetical protein
MAYQAGAAGSGFAVLHPQEALPGGLLYASRRAGVEGVSKRPFLIQEGLQ